MSNLEISRAERLDQYVTGKLPELSRAYVSKLITNGIVRVNGEVITKAGYKIRPSDEIEIDYRMAEKEVIPEIELEVLYEDEDCVVICKPAGILSHSKGAFNPEATVASWLQQRLRGIEGDRAGIVHRLDRGTSGVMIAAKTSEASSWLQKQFAKRNVKKIYQAIVQGSLDPQHAVIEMPIERNPKKPQTFRVGSNGKPALTEYTVIASTGDLSLLELKPTTGRTHQLRVHLNEVGHPIVGDTFYGGLEGERLYLHAKSLEITLPNRLRKVFTAPVPSEFDQLMKT